MNKKELRVQLEDLLEGGKQFNFADFPKDLLDLQNLAKPPSDWIIWIKRIQNIITKNFNPESAPIYTVNEGIEAAEGLQGYGETKFDKAKYNLNKALELGINACGNDKYNELIQIIDSPANSITKQISSKSDPKIVFVVHGRNLKARKALFQFLRSIGLQPLEWSQAVEMTGKASPYVGEVLDAAFSVAQAAIILFTPDDVAMLREEFRTEKEPDYEIELTGQARPNVIFEAGMAMGLYPDRTVLVELGELRPISDITGRHVIRMNNTVSRRQELAKRLKTADCAVNLEGTDWHEEGDFELLNETKKSDGEKTILFEPDHENDFKVLKYFAEFDLSHEFEVLVREIKIQPTLLRHLLDNLANFDFLNYYSFDDSYRLSKKRTGLCC